MESTPNNRNVQSNAKLRELARDQLRNNWTIPVITALAYFIFVIIIDAIPIPGTEIDLSKYLIDWFPDYFGDLEEYGQSEQAKIKIPILTTLISGPMSIGLAAFHLTFAKLGKAELPQIFDGFKQFLQSLIVTILMMIIMLVGFLLFVVPGIIAMIGLSQTYYIMADKPGVKAVDAMQQSWDMTKGYKLKLFLMWISFIPWFILSVFTCFIGLLWVIPYSYVSFAHFYLQLKGEEKELDIEDHLILE